MADNVNGVGEKDRLAQVVRHQYDGRTSLNPQRLKYIPEFFAGERIKRAKRFVEQQEFWRMHQGSTQRRTLLHAARQLPRILVLKAGKPDSR